MTHATGLLWQETTDAAPLTPRQEATYQQQTNLSLTWQIHRRHRSTQLNMLLMVVLNGRLGPNGNSTASLRPRLVCACCCAGIGLGFIYRTWNSAVELWCKKTKKTNNNNKKIATHNKHRYFAERSCSGGGFLWLLTRHPEQRRSLCLPAQSCRNDPVSLNLVSWRTS